MGPVKSRIVESTSPAGNELDIRVKLDLRDILPEVAEVHLEVSQARISGL